MRLRTASGLVGHWKFNEKQGLVASDSSRYKNHGTITLGAGKWQEKGLYFDGSASYVDCGNAASLNAGIGNLSIIVTTKKLSQTGLRLLVAKEAITDYQVRITSTGRVGSFFRNATTAISSTDDGVIVSNNLWHTIAVVFNRSSNMVRYIDGVQTGTLDNITTITGDITNALNLLIGQYLLANTTYNFNGTIDEVRIYNRALSAGEIKRQYKAEQHNYI